MTTLEQRLQERIESAVQEYLRESRAKVAATLKRAFGAATWTPVQRAKSASRAGGCRGMRQAPNGQRTRGAALGEQLYHAIAASPGEGMVTLTEKCSRPSGNPSRRLTKADSMLTSDTLTRESSRTLRLH
jgi:hypothetical protein